jgi:hypothetical protein
MTGKKIVRMMALALPVMALMAAGPILVTQSHSSDSVSAGISERPGKQLTLTFTNDTGVEVDGLQSSSREFLRAYSPSKSSRSRARWRFSRATC